MTGAELTRREKQKREISPAGEGNVDEYSIKRKSIVFVDDANFDDVYLLTLWWNNVIVRFTLSLSIQDIQGILFFFLLFNHLSQ